MSKKVKSLFKFKRSTPDLSDWGKHDEKLLLAVEHGDLEKVDTILTRKGVLATKLGPQGVSALHVAASQGNLQMVNLLLTHKVKITARDCQGRVALHCAARVGALDVCDKLISVGKDCGLQDQSGLTPLHHACLGGHSDCCSLLLKNMAPPNAADNHGHTPLFIAAQSGHPAICRDLIENGTLIDARDNEKCTALILAAKFGNRGVCEYLVRKGANVSLQDKQGHDAVWHADESGHAQFRGIFERAPTRASWTLEKEDESFSGESHVVNEEEAYVSENEKSRISDDSSTHQSLDSPYTTAPAGDVLPPEIQVEVGVVPFREGKGDSSGEEDQSSFESEQPESMERTHRRKPPGKLASVSEEGQAKTQDTSLDTTNINIEDYHELEEEHEGLLDELQRANQEKRQLEQQMERLQTLVQQQQQQQRLQSTNFDAETILEIENELDCLKTELETERNKNVELEEELRYLKMSSSEAESKHEVGVEDKDRWSDSDNDLFDSPGESKEDNKKTVLLRSRIHSLNQENEQLKNLLQMPAEEESGDLNHNWRRRQTELEEENARLTELLSSYEDLENEYHSIRQAGRSTSMELLSVESAKTQLQSKVTQLQQENGVMKDALEHSLDKAGVTKEMRALSAKIDDLETERGELLRKVRSGSIENIANDVKALNENSSQVENNLGCSKNCIAKTSLNILKVEVNQLRSHINELESNNKTLQDSMDRNNVGTFQENNDTDREELYTFLQQRIADVEHENQLLKEGQFPGESRAQEELQRVQVSASRLAESKASLEQRLEATQAALRHTQAELERSEQASSATQTELQMARHSWQDAQDRMAQLVTKLQTAEETLDRERSSFDTDKAALHEERTALQDQCKQLREDLGSAHLQKNSHNSTNAIDSFDQTQNTPVPHIMQLEKDMYGSDRAKQESINRMGRILTDLYSENANMRHQLGVAEDNTQKDAEAIYQLQMKNISINEKLAEEQQYRWKEKIRIQELERQLQSNNKTGNSQLSPSKYEEKVTQLQNLVSQLKDDNSNVNNQLTSLVSSRDALQNERDGLREEVSTLKQQKDSANGHLQRLLYSVQTMQAISSSLSGLERSQFNSDLSQMRQSVQELLDGRTLTDVDPEEWTEEREQLWRHMRDELLKMRQEHQTTVDENEALKSKLQSAQDQMRGDKSNLYHLHQDRIRMEEQVVMIKQLQQEISTLKEAEKCSSPRTENLQRELDHLKQDLLAKIQAAESDCHHKSEEIRMLREEVSKSQQHTDSRDTQREVARLQQEMVALQEENTQLSMQLDRRESQQHSQCISLQQEVSSLQQRGRDLEQQVRDLQKHDGAVIDNLQQQLVQMKRSSGDLENELQRVQFQDRSDTEVLHRDMEKLRQHNEGLRIDLRNQYGVVEALQKDIKLLEERSNILNTKLQAEKESLLASDENNKSLKAEISRQSRDILELRQKLQRIPSGLNIEEVMQESASLKHEIADLKQRDMMIVVTGQKGDDKLKENYDYLSKQSAKMREEMENLRTSLEQERQRSLESLRFENEKLCTKLNECKRENDQLRTSLLKLQNSSDLNSGKQSEIEKECRHLQQQNRELHAKVKQISRNEDQHDVTHLYKELDRRQKVVESAENTLAQHLGRLSPSFKHCDNLQEIMSKLEHYNFSKRDRDVTSTATITRLQGDVRKLLRENEEFRKDLTSQQAKLQSSPAEGSPDRQGQALQRQVTRLQRQLEEADQRHREVVATYRTHLLSAMQGQMDGEVQSALKHIVKLRSSEQFC